MAQIKPTVPHTRMGGKSFIKSSLYCSSALYETVLAKDSVGIYTSMLSSIAQYILLYVVAVDA